MFGIKTKKDKRIEELERELFLLRPTTAFSQLRQLGHGDHLICSVELRDDMPTDVAKRILQRELAKKLDNYIWYDVEDDGRHKKLCGELIVMKREF